MPDTTTQRWHGFAWMGELCTTSTTPPTYAVRYWCLCGCGREIRLPCALPLLAILQAWSDSLYAPWEG